MLGRANASAPFDPSNTRAFLQYIHDKNASAARAHSLVFEFGNELVARIAEHQIVPPGSQVASELGSDVVAGIADECNTTVGHVDLLEWRGLEPIFCHYVCQY